MGIVDGRGDVKYSIGNMVNNTVITVPGAAGALNTIGMVT